MADEAQPVGAEAVQSARSGVSPISGVAPPVHSRFGQPGGNNPKGGWPEGPPGPSLRRAYTRLLAERPDLAKQIVERIASEAVHGKGRDAIAAAQMLWDRDEGKAKQSVEHSGTVTNVTLKGAVESP